MSWITLDSDGAECLSINQIANQDISLRRIVKPLACENDTSNVILIEASDFSDGGIITGQEHVCYGHNGVFLTATNYDGEILTWQKSSDGITYTDIADTESHNTFSINSFTPGVNHYRVLVQKDNCSPEFSTPKTVTVSENLSNSMLTPNQIYCGPNVPEDIHATVPSGGANCFSIIWQYKSETSGGWTIVPNQPEFIHFDQPLEETTLFRQIVSDSHCSSISDTARVTIVPPTQAGDFTDTDHSQQVCQSTQPDPIVLTNFTGAIQDWFSAPALEGPWTALSHTDSVLYPGTLLNNRYYRAEVKSGICMALSTHVYQILSLPEITNNTISDNQVLCPGQTPEALVGSLPQGATGTYSVLWEARNEGGEWTDAPGMNSNMHYTPDVVGSGTEFRRIVSSAVCNPDTSNTVAITQVGNPSATWSSDGVFCPGTPITITAQLQGTPPFSITFNDGSENYTIDNINENSYTLTTYDTTETTYTLTAVTDAHCVSDTSVAPSVVVITPIAEIETPFAGQDQSVCGLSVELSGTEPNTNHLSYWSNIEGDLLSNSPAFTFTGQEPGLHELIYTVESPHCGQSVSDTVEVILDIMEPAVAGNNLEICSNSTALNATPVELCVGHWQVGNTLNVTDPFDPFATLSGMAHGNAYSILWITESIMGVCEPDTATLNIDVNPVSVSGTITTSNEVICQGQEVSVSLNDYVGSVTEWFVENSAGDIQSVVDSASVVTFSNLDTSNQIYAIVQSGVCLPDTTAPITVTVNPPTVAGFLNGDQTVCGDENSGTLMLAGYVGNILFWEVSEDGFATADTVWSSNPTYNFENLAATNQYRVTVLSEGCGSLTSNIATVNQSANPTATWSSDGIFCPGSPISITTHLEGTPPFSLTFNDGTDSFTIDNIDSNTYSIGLTDTAETTYTLTAVNDAHCSSDSDMPPSQVVVTPVPAIGNPSAGTDTTICGLSIDLLGTVPAPLLTSHWSNPEGEVLANTPELTFSAGEPGIHELIYTVESPLCNTSISDTITVVFDSIEAAEAGSDMNLCSTTTTLNATPVDWSVGHWLVGNNLNINDPFNPNATLSGLEHGNTYSILWITESIVGECQSDTAVLNINVSPISESGTITASSENLCQGEEVTLHLYNHVGTISQWLLEDELGAIEAVADSSALITLDELNASRQVFAVVQSGVCPPDTTAGINIVVSPQTLPGQLGSNQTVCSGINSGMLELLNYQGDILYWETSNDGFATTDTTFSANPTHSFENLVATRQYRATVKSGFCASQTSNVVTVTVTPPVELEINLPEMICSSDEPVDLSSFVAGTPAGVWTINGTTSNTLTPHNHTGQDVAITFTLNEEQCAQPFTGTITVVATPEITLAGSFETCGPITTISAETTAGFGTWSLDETLICNQPLSDETIEVTALEYGTNQVTFTAQNETCSSQEVQQLTFYAQPDSADAGENQILTYTKTAVLNAAEPMVGTGSWSAEDLSLSFGNSSEPNTEVRNLKTGTNWVTWTLTNGICTPSVSQLKIEVLDLLVPNAFSPNGDNVNDTYVIHGLSEFGAVSLTVWNRWGNTVYETTDYQNDWDGTNKNGNELATDTYYYLLEGKNFPKPFKGFIFIQR